MATEAAGNVDDKHSKLFDIIFNKDDVTWQSLIYELVKSEDMDPWDINITLLSQKYIEMLRQLKDMDFNISGKVVLAAALLLKMKSKKLVGEDLTYLDELFAQKDADLSESMIDEGGFDSFDEQYLGEGGVYREPTLIPKLPQPRKRKVSIYDLIDALQKAIEVKERRVLRHVPSGSEMRIPDKKVDISQVIMDVYNRIKGFFLRSNGGKVTFSALLPSHSKEDKVLTFIPLLHLSNQRKIDLMQQEHFGEIEIELLRKEKLLK